MAPTAKKRTIERNSNLDKLLHDARVNRAKRRREIEKTELTDGAVDLHVHTTASDGLLIPVQAVIDYMALNGKVMSFMDHDDFSASEAILQKFVDSRSNRKPKIPGEHVELVASLYSDIYGGAELSVGWEGEEIHVKALGYTGREEPDGFAELEGFLNETKMRKREARLKDLDKLNERLVSDDYRPVTPMNVDKIILSGKTWKVEENHVHYFGSPQIAYTIAMRNGGIKGRKGFLSVEKVYSEYVNRMEKEDWEYQKLEDVVEKAKNVGKIITVAHPFRYGFGLKELDALTDVKGIDGVEVFYPTHTKKQTDSLIKFADRKNLLKDAGSDHHTNEIKNTFGVKYDGQHVTDRNKHIIPLLSALDGKDLGTSIKKIYMNES